jgi:hypothetical protein
MTHRYFPNQFPDYNGEEYLNSQHQVRQSIVHQIRVERSLLSLQLKPQWYTSILRWIEQHLQKLEQHIDHHSDRSDESVYTGSAGENTSLAISP